MVAANRALLRADAYCQNNASCPFHSQGKGSIPKVSWQSSTTKHRLSWLFQTYLEILAAAQNASVAFDLQSGLLNLLSGQPDFPQLFQGFEGIIQGTSQSLSNSTLDPASILGIPILCSDTGNQLHSLYFSY
jgi:hypothetical protein